ncbi:DUF2332 family protein [Microbacterium sp. P06]|uniref:DUF2332 family protein n=1 Tax=Microbacterium sp. P06 TaxID=3366949 RepID=UPI003744D734
MDQDAAADGDADIAARYQHFAEVEAPGRSDLYAQWAAGVAADPETRSILARIPDTHRQPPLVFAVTRFLGAPEGDYPAWARWLSANAETAVAECGARSIQTNEPLRCAALLPALSLIDGPIALLEVGASAGICLYPDRYSYRYATRDGVVAIDPSDGVSPVVLESALDGDPLVRLPEVVWRAGIDLHPRDARDPDDRRWITGLAWPGEGGRADRMAAALDVVAADPPLLVSGDAADLLPAVAALAPPDATLVVTTPGVLAHVPRRSRRALIDAARAAGRWITIDAPALHDGWSSVPKPWPGRFALALDGDIVASVDPLGATVEWRSANPLTRV